MRIAIVFGCLYLVACGQEPSDAGQSSQVPVPAGTPSATPTTVASKSFRCPDGTIVAVDFMSDERSARVSLKGKPPVMVKGALKGSPMNGDGWIVRGGKESQSISLIWPGLDRSVICKA